MPESLTTEQTSTNLDSTLRWKRSQRILVAAGVMLGSIGVANSADQPETTTALPNVQLIDYQEPAPQESPSTATQSEASAQPSPEEQRAEQERLKDEAMVRAMINFAVNVRGMRRSVAEQSNFGRFIPMYRAASQSSGIPMEIIMGVHGMESTFAGDMHDPGNISGPMQMSSRAFNAGARNVNLPPELGPKIRQNDEYAIRAGGQYIRNWIKSSEPTPAQIEKAVAQYNGGTRPPRRSYKYARQVITTARDAGYPA